MPEPPQNSGHSVSTAHHVTCRSVRQEFEADLWLIVDSDQRPDLVERIRAGRLHGVQQFPVKGKPVCRLTPNSAATALNARPFRTAATILRRRSTTASFDSWLQAPKESFFVLS